MIVDHYYWEINWALYLFRFGFFFGTLKGSNLTSQNKFGLYDYLLSKRQFTEIVSQSTTPFLDSYVSLR